VLDATRPFAAATQHAEERLSGGLENSDAQIQAAAELAKVRTVEDRTIAKLQGMTPPADVRDLHGRILDVLRRTRTDIADAGAAADLGNKRSYQAALTRFSTDSRGLDALGPAFKSRGYTRLGQESG
jgi:hypothetical protein